MLTSGSDYDYDFTEFVKPVAELLDDEKAKIRFVASETLAVVASRIGIRALNNILDHILALSAF